MRKLLAGASALSLLLLSAPAFAGNAQQVGGVGLSSTDCTQGKVNVGNNQPLFLDSQGKLCVNAAISPSGTQTVQGSQSNAGAGTTGATNVPTNSYTYGWNGSSWIQALVDSGGRLQVAGSGPTAPGTAQSGSLLGGALFNSTLPTPTNTQQTALQSDGFGNLRVSLIGANSALKASVGVNSVFVGTNNSQSSSQPLGTSPFLYNGSTQDAFFTCPNTASVNVTAGNTTQIVGLSGSTVIRVCSVSLGISLTGSVNVVTGTGTNCGTPTTISTAMPLVTGQLWQQTAPTGGSLFRSTSGGEICISAATGNITGFITYVQF